MGFLPFRLIEILILNKAMTVSEIQQNFLNEGYRVGRRTIYPYLRNLYQLSPPGYQLTTIKKRSGKTLCDAYFLKLIK